MRKNAPEHPTLCQNSQLAGESHFSDEQEMSDPTEVTKLLTIQKQQLQIFIESLGENAQQPVDLRKYTQQILNICDCSCVDDREVIELANNTIRKMKNNKRLKRNWNKEDLTILLWVMEHYNKRHSRRTDEYSDSDWRFVAGFVPGKNASQCMFKWLSLKKNNLSEYPWTEKEERLLKELVGKKGKNRWIQISQELYTQNNEKKTFRSPKQCREHWTCYMDPELKKGPWRPQEDLVLLRQFVKLGKRWSQIAKKLYGRTQNAVKNRFNLLMMKQQKVQGRKRSHQHFSQLWIQTIQKEIQLNPNLMIDTDFVLSDDHQLEKQQLSMLHQRTNLPEEYINQITKLQNSTETQMTEHQSRVTLRVQPSDEYQQTMVKSIKFKRVPLAQLLKLTDLCPATFNQHSMEVSYKNEPCIFKQQHQETYGNIFNEEDYKDDHTSGRNLRYLYQQEH